MAWDKTLPADNETLRTVGTVTHNNFTAIEEGLPTLRQWGLNLYARVAAGTAVDPSRIDDVIQLYCKNDSVRDELYIINSESPADIIQLTRTSEYSIGASGKVFLPGGLIMKWGVTGAINKSSVASGNTTITFPDVFPAGCYSVVFTPQLAASSGDVDVHLRGAPTAAGFTVHNGTGQTFTLYYQAIGI